MQSVCANLDVPSSPSIPGAILDNGADVHQTSGSSFVSHKDYFSRKIVELQIPNVYAKFHMSGFFFFFKKNTSRAVTLCSLKMKSGNLNGIYAQLNAHRIMTSIKYRLHSMVLGMPTHN